jgi:hypothetical protein
LEISNPNIYVINSNYSDEKIQKILLQIENNEIQKFNSGSFEDFDSWKQIYKKEKSSVDQNNFKSILDSIKNFIDSFSQNN